MFCSRTNKYRTQHCSTDKNGNQTCYYVYHNIKSNVTAFQLDTKGVLGWASNIDRYVHYQSRSTATWAIEDVHLAVKNDGFYVIYEALGGRTRKERKENKKKSDKVKKPFTYAYFQRETGKFSVRTFDVNRANVKKKFRKTIVAKNVDVFNNKFYVTDTKFRLKPQWWIIGWTGFRTPGMLRGKGYFGNIEVIK